MKHIKKFSTAAQYTAYETSLALPNVSLIEETDGLHFNPYIPPVTHDYVEIGGVKWATMNLGAQSITDYGLYYQWGSTRGYESEESGFPNNAPYYDENLGDYGDYSKYNDTDEKTKLDAIDDAVTVAWGGNWKMPTLDEYIMLAEATTQEWTSDYEGSGVAGIILTSKDDPNKQLFFPAGQDKSSGSNPDYTDEYVRCEYWTSTFTGSCGNDQAIFINMYDENYEENSLSPDDTSQVYRNIGLLIRGILDE